MTRMCPCYVGMTDQHCGWEGIVNGHCREHATDRDVAAQAFKDAQPEQVLGYQELIDNGVWGLEGSIGREMARAIEDGRCILGPVASRDYWGNRIPAHHEVAIGTKGSVEYAIVRSDALSDANG